MEFNRLGNSKARLAIAQSLADKLGLATMSDLRRVMAAMLDDAKAGRTSDVQLRVLADATDQLQRLEAFDRPWVFGNRYMAHRFVSTDPMCPSCKNAVPHRTILVCPTCNCPGPWIMEERTLPSSYVHYALVQQVDELVNNELTLPGGSYRADGMTTAMPRGGAKSTWLCEIASEWLLQTERSRCLLLLSNTINQVIERSVEIRDEIDGNELMVRDFGVQSATRQEKRMWSQDDFVLANGSRVVARGAMQSMRGVKNKQYRPDVVISDDSDDEKYMTTSEQSRKLLDWWDTRVIPACHPNSLYMFHGTVLGEMALLWQQMTGNRGTTSAKMIIKAIQEGAGCSICGMPAERVGPFNCPVCARVQTAVSPHSFWGARFTTQALEAVRRKIGHWAWQSEYQQEPHDDSTSWFEKEWLDVALKLGEKLESPETNRRRVIPWSIISVTLTGEEMLKLAAMHDSAYIPREDEPGPYQLIVQCWDPAWANVKNTRDQKSCWMAGATLGLTWDDMIVVMWLDRARGLTGNSEYREWMHDSWMENGQPGGGAERQGQAGMIIERNGGGVLFQSDVEEHWGSVPMIDHLTGVEKHSLEDGIPGMASWFKDGRMIIRGAGPRRHPNGKPNEPGAMSPQELAEELSYELRMSGRSQYTDMLMTIWFGWAYINRWIRDRRDPARYDELARRNPTTRSGTHLRR